jgi:regulator of replication initiation timing
MSRKEELENIFKNADENARTIIKKLIEEAVYQESELQKLHEILDMTGFVRVHPRDPNIQKFMPAAKAYKELSQTYNNTIKTLNMIYGRNEAEPEDDPFSEFLNKYKKEKNTDVGID